MPVPLIVVAVGCVAVGAVGTSGYLGWQLRKRHKLAVEYMEAYNEELKRCLEQIELRERAEQEVATLKVEVAEYKLELVTLRAEMAEINRKFEQFMEMYRDLAAQETKSRGENGV